MHPLSRALQKAVLPPRRFFYDCEFMESPGNLRLISIGIVDEYGREFYACNSDADLTQANPWVRKNVIPLLPPAGNPAWMPLKQIRRALKEFFCPSKADPISLWAWNGAYDHVALCWVFGRMVDLPEGIPSLTRDIKLLYKVLGEPELPTQEGAKHDAIEDARWNLRAFRTLAALAPRTLRL